MMTKVLKDLDCNDRELSVLFTDNDYIAGLNKQYRNKEGPTNVLAFPMSGGESSDVESGMLGDVVISVDTAITESLDIGESIKTTIYRLLIHGILHLLGFDHERSSEDEEIMQKEEKRLFALIQED
ncbi:rRNA maturation RNase YbeY [Thermodesulfobacteriota bacterium]